MRIHLQNLHKHKKIAFCENLLSWNRPDNIKQKSNGLKINSWEKVSMPLNCSIKHSQKRRFLSSFAIYFCITINESSQNGNLLKSGNINPHKGSGRALQLGRNICKFSSIVNLDQNNSRNFQQISQHWKELILLIN